MFVLKRGDGSVVTPTQQGDRGFRFRDVDTKLFFEFVARDMKRKNFVTVIDPRARHVSIQITLNPVTGEVKQIRKKYSYPPADRRHHLSRAPANWGAGRQPAAGGPSNDACEGAIGVPCDGSSTVGDNTTAATNVADPGLSCHFDGPGEQLTGSLWYSFVATGEMVTIDTLGTVDLPGDPSTDTLLALYEGDCGSLVEIGCSDDDGGVGLLSQVIAGGLVVGNTYYIQTGSYSDSSRGEISLRVECTGGFDMGGSDDCDTAFAVDCGSTTVGDNTVAVTEVSDPGLSCHFDGPGEQLTGSLWYSFVATDTSAVVDTLETAGLAGGSSDTLLAVYDGTCDSLVEIGCSDDDGGVGLLSEVTLNGLSIGTTYLVQTGSYSDSSRGEIAVTVTCGGGGTGPANDECADAIDAGCDGSTVVGDNTDATTDGGDPGLSCHFDGPGVQLTGSLWYSFVATAAGVEINTFDTPNQTNPSTDTMMALYDGSCGSLTEIACSDDDGDMGLLSQIIFGGLTPGNTYYIQVGSYSDGSRGEIALTVTCQAVEGPANDDCADALPFACNSTELVDNTNATTEVDDPGLSCHFDGAGTQLFGSVWYTFVASDTSALLETNNSLGATDTLIAIYDGTCGNFTELACSEDDGVGLLSELCVTGLTPGNTYYIQAGTYSAASAGEIRLDLTCPCPAAPDNDNCEDAESIDSLPASIVLTNEFATDDQIIPCDTSIPTQNVWYSVIGNGNNFTATTCNDGTEVADTVINVFCGDCLEPLCVTGSDDACDDFSFLYSTATWGTQNGVEYLISVGNFPGNSGGRIRLDVTDDGTPAEDVVGCLPEGACCFEDGTCAVLTAQDCEDAGGAYNGDDTACDFNNVVDGSFEDAGAGWIQQSDLFGTPLCTPAICGFGGGTGPRTGDWWCWIGGAFAPESASVEQDFTIPTDAETLSYWLEIPVSSGNGFDFMNVLIDGEVVASYTEADGPFAGYIEQVINIEGYADGGVHTVRFEGAITGDDGLGGAAVSNFFVDDVAVNTVDVECRDCFVLNFDTQDDFSTPLVNGEAINSPPDFGNLVLINGIGLDTYGTAAFDSNPAGPNAGGPDPDLLIGSGNILILQENNQQSVPGFYDIPDDAQLGGLIEFRFVGPVELESIDLIDADEGPPVPQDFTIVLLDGSGNTRTYFVPGGWTANGGVGTLSLQTLADQPGLSTTAVAFQDSDFDRHDVVLMNVFLSSSGALDNVSFCSE